MIAFEKTKHTSIIDKQTTETALQQPSIHSSDEVDSVVVSKCFGHQFNGIDRMQIAPHLVNPNRIRCIHGLRRKTLLRLKGCHAMFVDSSVCEQLFCHKHILGVELQPHRDIGLCIQIHDTAREIVAANLGDDASHAWRVS